MNDPNGPESGSMDILYLLERLEEILSAGSRLPFTSRVLVDDDECFAIVDQIRLSLPAEIRQARKLTADRDTLLAETQGRAQQMLQAAETEARELARDHQITLQAEAQARELLAHAQNQADQIRRDADDYAYRVLLDLDRRLDNLAAVVRNGLQSLRSTTDPVSPTNEVADDEYYRR
jgi:cell division septum initiation protein DivIVA